MENEIIQFALDHWQAVFLLPLLAFLSKKFNNWLWNDVIKRIPKIWKAPDTINKMETEILERIDGLSRDHEEAAKQREKNKKEVHTRIDEIDTKLDDVDKKVERILGALTGKPE